jgi:hypothetical protein
VGRHVGGNVGADNGLVRVVVRNVHAGGIVLEVELGDVRGDECSSVGGDSGLVTISGQIGVVLHRLKALAFVSIGGMGLKTHQNVQSGENGPFDSRVLGRAFDQVRAEQSPGHGLRDTGFKPNGHWEGTSHLPKDHLLTSFSGDGLEQEGGGGSRVQVRQETVDTGFTESSQDGAEGDELLDGLEVVSVLALLGTLVLENVGQQGGVADYRSKR